MFLKPAVHRVTRKKVAVKLIDKMRLHTKEERVFKNEVMILKVRVVLFFRFLKILFPNYFK